MLSIIDDVVMHSDMTITTEILVLILPSAIIVLGFRTTIDYI